MGYILLHAVGLCGLLLAWYVAGVVVERLLFSGLSLPSYRQLTRLLLGILFWTAFLFAISALGMLHRITIWIALIALAVAAAVLLHRSHPSAEQVRRFGGRTLPPGALLPLTASVVVLGALFLLALRPTLAWDADTYHLTLPRIYIEHGGFTRVPFNVYSNWPMNVELLFALGLLLQDYLLATLIHFVFAALIVAALIRVCTVHGDPLTGAVAACLFLANDVVLFEAGIAYVDLAVAFFFLMALCYLLELERRPSWRQHHLTLAGVCCGLMAGAKLTGLFGLAAITSVLLWDALRARRFRERAIEALEFVALPCLVLFLPWLIKSTWYTGNPVYPFAFNVFGGPEWSRDVGAQFQAWQRSMGMGRSFRDYLLLPARVILSAGPTYDRFGANISRTWIVLVPAIVVQAWKDSAIRRCALAALVYFICWALSSQQERFLIPIVPILSAAVALALQWIWRAGTHTTRRKAPGLALGAVAGLYLLYYAAPVVAEGKAWLARYRSEGNRIVQSAVPAMDDFINTQLSPDAQILFLNTNHGFFCARKYIADSFFEASQINALLLQNHSVDDLYRVLRSQGITHILVGHYRWNIPYPAALGELLADERRTSRLYRSPERDVLFAIKDQ